MTDARSAERAAYEEARAAFEKLVTQDKVAFVVEATFTTLGHAVEDLGRGLGDLFEGLARDAEHAFSFGEPGRPAGDDDRQQGEPAA
jgi:hypothetical protein